MWRNQGATPARYTDVLELDLGTVEPSLAGPSRPQDRVPLTSCQDGLRDARQEDGRRARRAQRRRRAAPRSRSTGSSFELKDGAVLIAAITSCTNTSNPSVMLGAGLLARKARERGLTAQPWVKTSLAPGSRVVTDYFTKAGVLDDLAAIGFDLVGYGCTTCIAEGTPVLLGERHGAPYRGAARRRRRTVLFGPSAERRLALAVQSEMLIQGERDCVTLVLQDGRTPDLHA